MMKTNPSEIKYIRARSRVNKLKSFYRHVVIYIVSIALLFLLNALFKYFDEEYVITDILEGSIRITWIVWGIGILLHAFLVFGLDFIMGRNWEARKVEKYMNEDDSL